MAATLEDIRVKNRQLAASNLAQQGAIAEARNQLAVVRSSEYQVGNSDVRLCMPPASQSKPPLAFQARALWSILTRLAWRLPHAQSIRARFDELLARQAKVARVLGGPQFRERLENAVSKADSSSAALSAAFLAGKLPLEVFTEQYIEARTRHHTLDLKRQAAEQVLGHE